MKGKCCIEKIQYINVQYINDIDLLFNLHNLIMYFFLIFDYKLFLYIKSELKNIKFFEEMGNKLR